MNRRTFLQFSTAAGAALPAAGLSGCVNPPAEKTDPKPQGVPAFELDEISVADLSKAMAEGRLSAKSIVEKYLDRIREIDQNGPALNSVIELNPEALAIAGALDQERAAGKLRGPLHGIPVLIKDNIDTADRMKTTAGALALAENTAAQDAWIVQKLREAGAVILGKTNLSEWANFRSTRSSSGWSGRGGQTRNPNLLSCSPSGSSSGSGAAVAANLCALAIGTETNGSIISPASVNGIVGIKPTVGLWGRSGIIPISHTQDTAGPMARNLRDAAILLGVLTGVDPRDAVTRESEGKRHADYTQFLDPNGLQGARIGVYRGAMGYHEGVDRVAEAALNLLRERGAELVDLEKVTGADFGADEYTLLLYEFKDGVNRYLAGAAPELPVHSLKELIEFNKSNPQRYLPFFGQEILEQAEEKGDLTSSEYLASLENTRRATRQEGIDRVMAENQLDALVAPAEGPAWSFDLVNGDRYLSGGNGYNVAAIAGYPNITVPMGFLNGLPLGLAFFGRAYSEPTLLKLAYDFEQAGQHRKTPVFLADLV